MSTKNSNINLYKQPRDIQARIMSFLTDTDYRALKTTCQLTSAPIKYRYAYADKWYYSSCFFFRETSIFSQMCEALDNISRANNNDDEVFHLFLALYYTVSAGLNSANTGLSLLSYTAGFFKGSCKDIINQCKFQRHPPLKIEIIKPSEALNLRSEKVNTQTLKT